MPGGSHKPLIEPLCICWSGKHVTAVKCLLCTVQVCAVYYLVDLVHMCVVCRPADAAHVPAVSCLVYTVRLCAGCVLFRSAAAPTRMLNLYHT